VDIEDTPVRRERRPQVEGAEAWTWEAFREPCNPKQSDLRGTGVFVRKFREKR
jgi:hypothetical protein